MDFKNIKSFSIPQGEVKSLSINEELVWSADVEPDTPETITFTIKSANEDISVVVDKGTWWFMWCQQYNKDNPYDGGYWRTNGGYVYNNVYGYYLVDSNGNKVNWVSEIASGDYTDYTVNFTTYVTDNTDNTFSTNEKVTEGTTWAEWCESKNEVATSTGSLWKKRNGYVYNVTCSCYLKDSEGNKILWTDAIIGGAYSGYISNDTSEGLAFAEYDGFTYVSGIGTCTDVDIVIPRTTPEGFRVWGILDNAFRDCTQLTSVVIPEGVRSIRRLAFNGCSNLESITIPSSITEVSSLAFGGCTKIREDRNGITYVGNWVVGYDNGIEDASIGALTKGIALGAFVGCSTLKSVTFAEGTKYICDSAFGGCSYLTSVTLPQTLISIGESVFKDCTALVSINIPDGITHIDDETFYGCSSLERVTFGENSGLVYIGEYAFAYCESLTGIAIPDGVDEIDYYTFLWCTNLERVTIPPSVEIIRERAFEYCRNLDFICYVGTERMWNAIKKEDGWDRSITTCEIVFTPKKGTVTVGTQSREFDIGQEWQELIPFASTVIDNYGYVRVNNSNTLEDDDYLVLNGQRVRGTDLVQEATYIVGSEFITFTIDGVSYTAVIGTTWDEFTQANSDIFFTKKELPDNVAMRYDYEHINIGTNTGLCYYSDVIVGGGVYICFDT